MRYDIVMFERTCYFELRYQNNITYMLYANFKATHAQVEWFRINSVTSKLRQKSNVNYLEKALLEGWSKKKK